MAGRGGNLARVGQVTRYAQCLPAGFYPAGLHAGVPVDTQGWAAMRVVLSLGEPAVVNGVGGGELEIGLAFWESDEPDDLVPRYRAPTAVVDDGVSRGGRLWWSLVTLRNPECPRLRFQRAGIAVPETVHGVYAAMSLELFSGDDLADVE